MLFKIRLIYLIIKIKHYIIIDDVTNITIINTNVVVGNNNSSSSNIISSSSNIGMYIYIVI